MKALEKDDAGRAGKTRHRFILLFLLPILFLIFLLFCSTALAASTLSIQDNSTGGDCTLFGAWSAGTKTCTLTRDIEVSGIDAIHIDGNGITLDGAGHFINGNGTSNGVYVTGRSGVTIVNLVVTNFNNGIYLDWNISGSEVRKNMVSGNTTGIYLATVSNITVKWNTIRANTTGLVSFSPTNVLVYNNSFDGNVTHAGTLGSGTTFNLPAPIGGNWWSGWTSPDVNSDGFVDSPYVIIYLNYDQDNLPWVSAPVWDEDQRAPVISNLQPVGTVHTGAVTITADYNDPAPSDGVNTASVTASFTGGPAPLPTLSCTATGSPSGSISCTPSSNLSEGMYYVQVSITDNRGNTATSAGAGFWVLPYHIFDMDNGYDCESIGSWDAAAKTCTLDTNMTTAGIDAIHIESDGVTLDGGGRTIAGINALKAGVVVIGRTGVTVRNIKANNFSAGIYLESSQDCQIEKNAMLNDTDGVAVYYGASNRITGNSFDCGNHNIYMKSSSGNSISANNMSGHVEGIRLDAATGNLVRGNSLIGNSRGLAFVFGASGNTVTSNSVRNMGNFLYFSGSGVNTFHSNSFNTCYSSPVQYVSGGANIFNGGDSVGGNWWSVYDTPGEGCVDSNVDGFCDAPYTPATGAGTDNEPWTTDQGWQPDYYWTWYDNVSAANWVLMANRFDGVTDIWYDLSIGGTGRALTPLSGHAAGQAPPGHTINDRFAGVRGGPVEVNGRAAKADIVSQRTLWNGGNSLEEVLGVKDSRLSSHYYWTWYDNRSAGTYNWVMVSNPGDTSIYYRIKVAGAVPATGQILEGAASGTIEGGQSRSARFDLRSGPVEVETWSDAVGGSTPVDSIASQRVLTNMGTASEAFNEVPGIPESELTNDYLWTWYDNVSPGAYDWVLVANPNSYPIYYRITVKGSVPDQMIEGSPTGTIPAGMNVTPRIMNTSNGPVEVKTCKEPFGGISNDMCSDPNTVVGRSIASQRTLWGPSFEEVPGYPRPELASDYHWTWYDQYDAGTYDWVHIINTNSFPVYYEITVGGSAPSPVVEGAASGTIQPGELVHPRFLMRGGPVEVRAWKLPDKVDSAHVMTSQRVLWHGYFNEVLGMAST